jgi:hypothetical protein
MQPDWGTGFAVDFAGSKYVIKMGMGVDDTDDFEAHGFDRGHDALWVSARIKYVTDSGFGVTDDAAITLQRAYRKGFSDDIHRIRF